MISVDFEKHKRWDQLLAFTNELISTFERGSVAVEVNIDSGLPSSSIPTESDVSSRLYSVAFASEASAQYIEEATDVAENNRRGTSQKNAYTTEGSVPLSEETATANPDGTVSGFHAFSNFDEQGLHGNATNTTVGLTGDFGPLIGKELRENSVIKWFQDCFACSGRVEITATTDLAFPELLSDLDDYLNSLLGMLDISLDMLDSSQFLAQLCSIIAFGKWCIPDLLAFLGILNSLLIQYGMTDPSISLNWWDLFALLFVPILDALSSLANSNVHMSIAPIMCIKRMLKQVRSAIEGVETFDRNLGWTLGQFQRLDASASGPFSESRFGHEVGNLEGDPFGVNPTEPTRHDAPIINTIQKELLSGKVDWFEGDTLGSYSEVLGILSPIEHALLATMDFDTRNTAIAQWLREKLSVLRSIGLDALRQNIQFINVILSLTRLYRFIDVIIKLISNGRDICKQEVDSNGNLVTIPLELLSDLFTGTAVLPEWVTMVNAMSGAVGGLSSTGGQRFTIIDTSLGVQRSSIGCAGRISASDAEKVTEWMKELDEFEP